MIISITFLTLILVLFLVYNIIKWYENRGDAVDEDIDNDELDRTISAHFYPTRDLVQQTIKEECEQRVQRGIKLLNKEHIGWEQKIDLTRLHIHGATTCILGQLFMHYPNGLIALHLTNEMAIAYGFLWTPGRTNTLYHLEMLWLEYAWREHIRKMQEDKVLTN